MSIKQILTICLLSTGLCFSAWSAPADTNEVSAGPLYSRVALTLEPGMRTEIVSPIYHSQEMETGLEWGISPFFSHHEDPATDSVEDYFLYPFLTYYRYGKEHRWQLFQLISTAGGRTQQDTTTHRFTLFPVYFRQRSDDPKKNYTAVFPICGHLENRLFRDEIDFTMFPAYSKTRKKDVVNYNMPYPFYNKRYGNGMYGWQFWPFIGHEHKVPTLFTNSLHEVETNGGHDSQFLLWPFFTESTNGIGTTNWSWQEALLPLRTSFRSPQRDSDSWGWPLGVTHTIDREKKYEEWETPWPLYEFANGEGKYGRRYFPFYSISTNKMLVDKWYCWPVYKYNRIDSPPLYRERTRICFFLYSDTRMRSTETGRELRRKDLWPFFLYRHELNGNERLQVLALIEPFFPLNPGIARDYGPFYSIWRAEKNPTTQAQSQSLFWNLYRRESAPGTKKISLLFGLFQYESSPSGSRWRVCYIPGTSRPLQRKGLMVDR